MVYSSIVSYLLRVNKHFIRFIKTRFARINSDDNQHICLLWPQILALKLTGPGDLNSRLYELSDGTTPVDFLIMCKFYDSVKKGLFRPFYPQFGAFGWPRPDSTRLQRKLWPLPSYLQMKTLAYKAFQVSSHMQEVCAWSCAALLGTACWREAKRESSWDGCLGG